MKGIKTFLHFIESVNEAVGRGVSWVTLGLVSVVFADVIMRYALGISFVFVQELEWHLFSVIFLIGAGFALLHDEHVRVDIFYQGMSKKRQSWVNCLGATFFLFPGCFLVIATGIPFVVDSFRILEGSPDPGGIPFRFVLKAMVPIGFALVALQGISLFIRSLFNILEIELEDPGIEPETEGG